MAADSAADGDQERTAEQLRAEIEFWSGRDSMDNYVESLCEELAAGDDSHGPADEGALKVLDGNDLVLLNDADAAAAEIAALEEELEFWRGRSNESYVEQLTRRRELLEAAAGTARPFGSVDSFAAYVEADR